MSEWIFTFLFFVFGLVLGRLAAILSEFFSEMDKSQDKSPQSPGNFFSFFRQCQKKWGVFPCSFLMKGLSKGCPFRSLALELCMAVLFALLFFVTGCKYVLPEYLIFTFALVTACAVDIDRMILPDSLTLSGIAIGLIGALLNPEEGREFWPALAGMLMGGGFLWFIAVCYYAVRKEEGLGGGDIKLLAWIGAVLTWKAVPFVILLSCFAGLFTGLIMAIRAWAKKYLQSRRLFGDQKGDQKVEFKNYLQQSLPFGPYLAGSALIYIFCGKKLAHLYLTLFLPL